MSNSSINIISRLSGRFAGAQVKRIHPDFLTRDIGGHWRQNHPYISGYFQIMVGLPEILFDNPSTDVDGTSSRGGTSGTNNSNWASKWLHSTCESFTPHTQTINKVDVPGQGQIGSSYVASVTTGREISFAFREYQALPILGIIKQWASVMDPFTGMSPLGGSQYLPPNYKGWIAVVQNKPTRSQNNSFKLSDIEECYIYQGVFPTTIPLDAINSDITANDTTNLSVTFSFDGAPLTSAEEQVSEKCIELLNNMQVIGEGTVDGSSTFNEYMTNGLETSQWAPVLTDSIPTTEVAQFYGGGASVLPNNVSPSNPRPGTPPNSET